MGLSEILLSTLVDVKDGACDCYKGENRTLAELAPKTLLSALEPTKVSLTTACLVSIYRLADKSLIMAPIQGCPEAVKMSAQNYAELHVGPHVPS